MFKLYSIASLLHRGMKEMVGITREGETVLLGRFTGSEWSLMDSLWTFNVQKMLLSGPRTVGIVSFMVP